MHSRVESKGIQPYPPARAPSLSYPAAAENYADGGEKLW